ncbi:helix-turn-helix domain-containing protein [Porphyromonas endodontalis]|uniref:helix-turn-helix domain-containing protein n=1 Tax=Porphyromonas endodontalis TaxID=28124 RepID=UPI0028EAACAE|nr:helix-turn-helix domain-containing protein [Porphyromonas endodontalis]
MPLKKKTTPEKLFYSPHEVCELIGEDVHTLYYWEDTFGLSIERSRGGHRRYTPQNIETLRLIHFLIRERKFTSDGVKHYLQTPNKEENKRKVIEQLRISLNEVEGLLKAFNAYRLSQGSVHHDSNEEPFE